MSSRGRKRRQAVRTPSGQPSRAKEYLANVEPFQTRQRLYGLNEKDSRDQKAATVIGRLLLSRQIAEPQYDAGVEFLDVRRRYLSAIKAPDALRNGTGAGGDVSETAAYAEWCRQAIARHDAAMAAVRDEQCLILNRGASLYAALDYCVCRNEQYEHMVGDLRIALNALAHHFGLTGGGKSRSMRMKFYGPTNATERIEPVR